MDPDVPEQRILEQAMRLASGGAVTGWAACRMHGAAFFDGLRDGGRTRVPVPLSCGPLHQIRRQPGDDLIRDILNPDEIVVVRDVPSTTVQRATFDAVRYARNVREAVVPLDMMAAADGCSATPTCSTRRRGSSASTTAPTTAPRGSTATTSTGRPASATTCSRSSGSPAPT